VVSEVNELIFADKLVESYPDAEVVDALTVLESVRKSEEVLKKKFNPVVV